MYELRNATDTDAPMFGVERAGGVARKERANRVDAMGGIGFLGIEASRHRGMGL